MVIYQCKKCGLSFAPERIDSRHLECYQCFDRKGPYVPFNPNAKMVTSPEDLADQGDDYIEGIEEMFGD